MSKAAGSDINVGSTTAEREIKFRAWDKERKEYRLVTQLDPNVYSVSATTDLNGHDPAWDENKDLVLEQYTGLKDKNGKEIYEGDIIKELMHTYRGRECTTTWVVRWNSDEFCYDLYRIAGALFGDSMLATCNSKDCEVIGSIHENPELFEKGEQNGNTARYSRAYDQLHA